MKITSYGKWVDMIDDHGKEVGRVPWRNVEQFENDIKLYCNIVSFRCVKSGIAVYRADEAPWAESVFEILNRKFKLRGIGK